MLKAVIVLRRKNFLGLQDFKELGWQDSSWCCQAQYPEWGAAAVGEGCLLVNSVKENALPFDIWPCDRCLIYDKRCLCISILCYYLLLPLALSNLTAFLLTAECCCKSIPYLVGPLLHNFFFPVCCNKAHKCVTTSKRFLNENRWQFTQHNFLLSPRARSST
jgi:hypothetical protein